MGSKQAQFLVKEKFHILWRRRRAKELERRKTFCSPISFSFLSFWRVVRGEKFVLSLICFIPLMLSVTATQRWNYYQVVSGLTSAKLDNFSSQSKSWNLALVLNIADWLFIYLNRQKWEGFSNQNNFGSPCKFATEERLMESNNGWWGKETQRRI